MTSRQARAILTGTSAIVMSSLLLSGCQASSGHDAVRSVSPAVTKSNSTSDLEKGPDKQSILDNFKVYKYGSDPVVLKIGQSLELSDGYYVTIYTKKYSDSPDSQLRRYGPTAKTLVKVYYTETNLTSSDVDKSPSLIPSVQGNPMELSPIGDGDIRRIIDERLGASSDPSAIPRSSINPGVQVTRRFVTGGDAKGHLTIALTKGGGFTDNESYTVGTYSNE